MKYILPLLVVLTLLPVTVTEARTVIRTGETVSIAADQKIEGDFYSAVSIASISGEIEQDAVIAAGQLTINGTVGADALLIGGSVDVHGTIGDDLRVIGGEVTVAEPVLGDVFIIGGTVNILSTASVTGDVVIFGGDVTISGSVGGDIIGRMQSLRIDAPVAGEVDVTVTELTLGDRAAVIGAVRYVSTDLAIRSQNATIGGELVRNDPILTPDATDYRLLVIPFFVLLFAGLAWYLVARRLLGRVVSRALSPTFKSGFIGLLAFFLVPVAVMVLLVSVIGSMVGFVLLTLYMLTILLSIIAASALFGQILFKIFNQPPKVSLQSIVVGTLCLQLVMFIPVVGAALFLGLMLLAFSALVDVLTRSS